MKQITLFILILLSVVTSGQNVNYEAHIASFTGNCTSGNNQYTWKGWLSDNINTGETYSGCQKLDIQGKGTKIGPFAVRKGENTAAIRLRTRINAWEDNAGSRCNFDTPNFSPNQDACRAFKRCNYNFSNPLEYQATSNTESCGTGQMNMSVVYSYQYNTVNLSEAVENTIFSYSPGGDRPFWGSTGTWGLSDNDCATSGTITHDETSSFSIEIKGSGELSFNWRVDSEPNADFLEVYLNGTKMNSISGNIAWANTNITLPNQAVNIVEWRYTKNDNTSTGIDRGFVDDISFVSTDVAPKITNIVRHNPTVEKTNADNLAWDISFDEAVENIDSSDFVVTNAAATIAVSKIIDNTYRVIAFGPSLENLTATVTLGFTAMQNITDVTGNALTNVTPTNTNESTYILDNEAPTISSVSIPNSAAKVSDQILVSIVANEAGLTLNTGQLNGVDVADFTDEGAGNYTATYTVAEGNTDRSTTDDIPVTFVLSDSLGNVSNAYTTAISQNADAIDANSPSIFFISIPNTSAKIGDQIPVTIIAGESDLSLNTGQINGVPVTGFNGMGNFYTAIYTVTQDDIERANDDNIPINFILSDALGNNSTAYTTDINQNADAIDTSFPLLTSTSPNNNALAIDPSSNLVLNFSEPIQFGAGTIQLRQSNTDVLVFSIDTNAPVATTNTASINTNSLTITSGNDLEGDTNYYVVVSNTAIRDANGNHFSGIHTTADLNFTTSAPPTLSLDNTKLLEKDLAYNNPVSDQLIFKGSTEVVAIQIFNLTGKNVASSNTNSVDVKALENGIYIALVTTNTGENRNFKLVKN